jgi:hypothetical protein
MAWFDARQVEPATGSATWPLGKHPVVIIAGHRKSVKDKPQSGMLEFTLRVIDGPSKNFEGGYRLNLWNENPQAAEIASKQLSSLCHVTGQYVLESENAAELFNKPFVVLVTSQKNDEKYTEISAVFDMHGQPPVRQAAPTGPAQPAAPPPQATPAPTPAPTPAWGAPAAQPAPQATVTPASWGGTATQPPAPAQAAPTPAWGQQPSGNAAPPWGR